MKNKKTHWGVLAPVAFIALLSVLPPLSKSKARTSRITGVNNVASFSMTSTNALTSAEPSK